MEDGERNARVADCVLAFIVPFADFVFGFAIAAHRGELDDVADAGCFRGLREVFFVNARLWADGERKNTVNAANRFVEESEIFEISPDDIDASVQFRFRWIPRHGADFLSGGQELRYNFTTDGACRACYENHGILLSSV